MTLAWKDTPESGDETILRPVSAPFSARWRDAYPGGQYRPRMHQGLRRGARPVDRRGARAVVFDDQLDVLAAFKRGELERDIVVVVRFQGPRANGMPELHKLTPPLGVLQNRGFKVALVTDGRMSGASGKVPCAIHCSPEALLDGAIGRIRDGDLIRVDAVAGTLDALVDPAEWAARPIAVAAAARPGHGPRAVRDVPRAGGRGRKGCVGGAGRGGALAIHRPHPSHRLRRRAPSLSRWESEGAAKPRKGEGDRRR